jgi:SAM-dependent methyltransferase
MYLDVVELRNFYANHLGQVARRTIRREVRKTWPNVEGMTILGLGYATPYLTPFRQEAERVIALMPAQQGVTRWPEEGPGLVGLSEETDLPLPDASADRVLLVHGLENSETVRPLLREIWRVLTPEGKLMVIAPNRRGLWAATERTPFGHGRPYSRGQVSLLLSDCMYAPENPNLTLYMPPFAWRFMLRSSGAWENAGHWLWPGFGGIVMIEATKRIYAATSVRAPRRVLRPVPVRPAQSAREPSSRAGQ